jgi:hypothetical protein
MLEKHVQEIVEVQIGFSYSYPTVRPVCVRQRLRDSGEREQHDDNPAAGG